jgi:hypothetical protein
MRKDEKNGPTPLATEYRSSNAPSNPPHDAEAIIQAAKYAELCASIAEGRPRVEDLKLRDNLRQHHALIPERKRGSSAMRQQGSIPPTWGTGEVSKLRGAKEIAEYHCGTAEEYRTVYNECARGTLPHWREGAVICSNTRVIDLYKLLQMVYRLRRKEFTAAEAVKCISLFDLAMQGIRPSQDDIATVLKRAGVI